MYSNLFQKMHSPLAKHASVSRLSVSSVLFSLVDGAFEEQHAFLEAKFTVLAPWKHFFFGSYVCYKKHMHSGKIGFPFVAYNADCEGSIDRRYSVQLLMISLVSFTDMLTDKTTTTKEI